MSDDDRVKVKSADLSAVVKATVTVEITVGQWGASTNFDDLHEQVSREAENKIRARMGNEARIVGSPIIEVIVFKRK